MNNKIIAEKTTTGWRAAINKALWVFGITRFMTDKEIKNILTESYKKMIDSIILNVPLGDVFYNQWCKENCSLTLDYTNKKLSIVIAQPLAMSVARGQWNYGGRTPITINLTIEGTCITIERPGIEVLPYPSTTDPFSYNSSAMFLQSFLGVFYTDERRKGVEWRVDNIKQLIRPLLEENVRAQFNNLIINNADAESD
ncbi:MAG: hypothetical protein PHV30_07850 [Candidatus Margulisbacteria bacterium]|nr:hypothetical protein [Candidatus Margulisiibacteriota bacterium]